MTNILPAEVVLALRKMLQDRSIPVTEAARRIGISRVHLQQMLKGRLPMRVVYGLALRQMVTDKALES